MGMVDCAYLVAMLVERYKIGHLFMIGVCGGRESTGIKIGDLVVPNEVVTYQNGKLTDKGIVPDYSYVQTNSGIINMLDSKDCDAILKGIYKKFQKEFEVENDAYLGVKLPL